VQPTFGTLLRRYRLAAGLSQDRLAERAGMSAQALSALENGRRQAPYRHTVALLAGALDLSPAETALLEAAVVRSRSSLIGATSPASEDHATGEADYLPPPSPPAHPGNLPLQLTSFIGRDREIAEVTRLLGSTRLLTLTGTGGTGKTRLALQAAASLHARYPQGVWLAELAPLTDPALVPLAVAGAVGLREESGQALLATLVAALRSRQLLLVLDNCEHLLDASATLVEALLRGCPQVAVLATSREALGVAGETMWRVPSLALPSVQHLPPPEALAQGEAVRLFVERALAVQPHFALTAQNARVVAQICRRLDGIPLAIELAAARLGGLAIEHLAARLDQRFRLLTGGRRTAPARQQTLQATVDWSYHLLSVPEQTLFNRLAIFSGGFTLEAAEAVCAGGPIASEAVLDLLLRLVDKSLVTVEARAGDVERYRLLETLRQYAHERLLVESEAEALHVRHTSYYCALAEESERALFGPLGVAWLDRLDAESMNIRQALRWALDERAAQEGLRLAGALMWYWHFRGYLAEGTQWLADLLALPEAAARTTARARALLATAFIRRSTRLLVGAQAVGVETRALVAEAVSIARETGDRWVLAGALVVFGRVIVHEDYLMGRAMLEESLALCRELDVQGGLHAPLHQLGDFDWEQGDRVAAALWWSESLGLARRTGDQDGIGNNLRDLGMLAYHEGDYALSRGQIEESLAACRALRSRMGVTLSLSSLGLVARAQGDTILAQTCFEEKLALWREVGDRTGIAASLTEWGALAQQEGDHAQAHALFQEALTLWQDLGDTTGVAAALAHLGDLAAVQDDHERAAALYREGLNLLRGSADRATTAACLEGLAAVAMAAGRWDRAARLFGASTTLRTGAFVLYVWDERATRDRQVDVVRTALGEEPFARAWEAGKALSPEQAIAAALEDGADD
jgi:predicted ATPase/transcriptional regulator with XRE-family HTH domain